MQIIKREKVEFAMLFTFSNQEFIPQYIKGWRLGVALKFKSTKVEEFDAQQIQILRWYV